MTKEKKNDDKYKMLNGREITNYEKGLLTGVAIGAVLGPSFTLVMFCLIICYDLGRPQIIDVGQKAVSRIIGLKEEDKKPTQLSSAIDTIKDMDPNTLTKIVDFGLKLGGGNVENEEK